MADSDESDVYQFVAGGDACERCAALDGSVWHAPPNPPHAHCACEVTLKPKGHHRPRECGDNYWTMESLPDGTVHYGTDNSFEWGFLVTIDCWDGGAYSFEIWVDMGRDADYEIGRAHV